MAEAFEGFTLSFMQTLLKKDLPAASFRGKMPARQKKRASYAGGFYGVIKDFTQGSFYGCIGLWNSLV